jgi:hypothetical protein
MSHRFRAFIIDITAALLFGLALALAVPEAYAGMIQPGDPQREELKSLLERPEVAKELEQMGIPPQEAAARVDAMTPQEVSELKGRIDRLAAGGAVSTQDLLLIIILLLVLVILL